MFLVLQHIEELHFLEVVRPSLQALVFPLLQNPQFVVQVIHGLVLQSHHLPNSVELDHQLVELLVFFFFVLVFFVAVEHDNLIQDDFAFNT